MTQYRKSCNGLEYISLFASVDEVLKMTVYWKRWIVHPWCLVLGSRDAVRAHRKS
jgi:hypothetical protein